MQDYFHVLFHVQQITKRQLEAFLPYHHLHYKSNFLLIFMFASNKKKFLFREGANSTSSISASSLQLAQMRLDLPTTWLTAQALSALHHPDTHDYTKHCFKNSAGIISTWSHIQVVVNDIVSDILNYQYMFLDSIL